MKTNALFSTIWPSNFRFANFLLLFFLLNHLCIKLIVVFSQIQFFISTTARKNFPHSSYKKSKVEFLRNKNKNFLIRNAHTKNQDWNEIFSTTLSISSLCFFLFHSPCNNKMKLKQQEFFKHTHKDPWVLCFIIQTC